MIALPNSEMVLDKTPNLTSRLFLPYAINLEMKKWWNWESGWKTKQSVSLLSGSMRLSRFSSRREKRNKKKSVRKSNRRERNKKRNSKK